jgi:hypothetical protein
MTTRRIRWTQHGGKWFGTVVAEADFLYPVVL